MWNFAMANPFAFTIIIIVIVCCVDSCLSSIAESFRKR